MQSASFFVFLFVVSLIVAGMLYCAITDPPHDDNDHHLGGPL